METAPPHELRKSRAVRRPGEAIQLQQFQHPEMAECFPKYRAGHVRAVFRHVAHTRGSDLQTAYRQDETSKRLRPVMQSPRPRRIIVFCLPGIGDAVLFTPALALLRRSFPEAHITVTTMFRGTADIL